MDCDLGFRYHLLTPVAGDPLSWWRLYWLATPTDRALLHPGAARECRLVAAVLDSMGQPAVPLVLRTIGPLLAAAAALAAGNMTRCGAWPGKWRSPRTPPKRVPGEVRLRVTEGTWLRIAPSRADDAAHHTVCQRVGRYWPPTSQATSPCDGKIPTDRPGTRVPLRASWKAIASLAVPLPDDPASAFVGAVPRLV